MFLEQWQERYPDDDDPKWTWLLCRACGPIILEFPKDWKFIVVRPHHWYRRYVVLPRETA
jgi:hypothetical protein